MSRETLLSGDELQKRLTAVAGKLAGGVQECETLEPKVQDAK